MEYRGYVIEESGSYTKVDKKTTTIQVKEPLGESFIVRKKIKFFVKDLTGKERAIKRAKQFVDDTLGREL